MWNSNQEEHFSEPYCARTCALASSNFSTDHAQQTSEDVVKNAVIFTLEFLLE